MQSWYNTFAAALGVGQINGGALIAGAQTATKAPNKQAPTLPGQPKLAGEDRRARELVCIAPPRSGLCEVHANADAWPA